MKHPFRVARDAVSAAPLTASNPLGGPGWQTDSNDWVPSVVGRSRIGKAYESSRLVSGPSGDIQTDGDEAQDEAHE